MEAGQTEQEGESRVTNWTGRTGQSAEIRATDLAEEGDGSSAWGGCRANLGMAHG